METPSRFLKKILSYQKKGKALDIAMGRGRNAFFLAQNGYEVDGIEISKESIAECQRLIEAKHLPVKVIESDLEKISLPENAYDLVICFFYLQRDLFPRIRSAVKKGGWVVYETFLIDQHLQQGSPKRKEFCLGHNELLDFFRDFRVLYYEEGLAEDDKITARIIAQKK